jgi:hypothetical protein
MSLITANTGGSTKRTTLNALFFISYCAGNIIGPFAFKPSEAPVYRSGIIAIMVAYFVEIAVLICFALFSANSNGKESALKETRQDNATVEEKCAMAFRDLTDLENPFSRFSY